MKYYEIYEEYLRSKEFEEDIIKLEKTESKDNFFFCKITK